MCWLVYSSYAYPDPGFIYCRVRGLGRDSARGAGSCLASSVDSNPTLNRLGRRLRLFVRSEAVTLTLNSVRARVRVRVRVRGRD